MVLHTRYAAGDAARGHRPRRAAALAWLAALAMLPGLAAGPAAAETLAYAPGMVCGADPARPDRDDALAQRIAATPRGAVAYYRFGQGSPIVLVTGYRATMAEWNAYFLGELARTHEVIVFDNRGIGRSVARAGGDRLGDLSRDTGALIETLGLKDVTVLGWSMGGAVAQLLALEQPALVSRLVLLSTLPPGRASVPVSGRVEQVLSGSGKGHYERVMDLLFPPAVAPRAAQCFLKDMFTPPGYGNPAIPPAVTRQQDAMLRAWHGDDRAFGRLRQVAAPALVLAGTDDAVLAPRNARVLAQALPRATLDDVAGGGHAMMYQYPRQLAQRISAFIGR
ncbi:alpha/beta fold hydrolase [Cupriavidus sp. 30B13]|uniref:alpha/beta fold hydrolase n=1 Tax=Cupriavidus sp. 30B13 TaxID=3384241 RepID=UPI003B9145CB